MPQIIREMFQTGIAYDEPDRMPDNINISNLDIIMYVVAILGHFVDLGLDINIAVRYSLAGMMTEFGWTLAFILIPAFVNTAVSIRMYAQDKQQNSLTNELTRRKWIRIFILILQMAPILRFADALIYAIKSRRAANRKDVASQKVYFGLMLKEDSDAALLRIFECFLEAAPQQVLQTSLLLRAQKEFAVHQILSIISSVVGMGWCLAAYQRAIRFAQNDKSNMTWYGTMLQTVWHFLVTLSRISSVAAVAYLFPHWTAVACLAHVATTAVLLQIFDQSDFCSQNKLAEVSFSVALGAVYIFTYVVPVEGRTRYRYAVYYAVCFVQNVICSAVWFYYSEDGLKRSVYFLPMLVLCVLPFVVGVGVMVVYYAFFHPKLGRNKNNSTVSFKVVDQTAEFS